MDCPPVVSAPVESGDFKYGIFSAKAKELFGSVFYQSFDDPTKEVEVTCVDSNDITASSYKWEDKIYVGKVGKCLYKRIGGLYRW
jgi:hypothetical protein